VQEVTASGNIVDADPRASELIKIARAFDSEGDVTTVHSRNEGRRTAPQAPLSVAPKGFAAGSALGALLQAGQAAGEPPVVLWGRQDPAAGKGAESPGAVDRHAGEVERRSSESARQRSVGVSRQDKLGAGLVPNAPASDLLGSRLPRQGQKEGNGASSVHQRCQSGLDAGSFGEPATESPPAAPLSVADATVITSLSETPGWGAYAPTDKRAVVARRKAVVQKHAGMFTQMSDLFFGTSASRVVHRQQDASSSDSEDGLDKSEAEEIKKRSAVPPSPASSAHLRELLAKDSTTQEVAADLQSGKTAADGRERQSEQEKTAGPMTMMRSWVPSTFRFTTWQRAAEGEENVAGLPTPAQGREHSTSEGVKGVSDSGSGGEGGQEGEKQGDQTAFALQGLGAKLWKVRRRTIPMKPMTADEREVCVRTHAIGLFTSHTMHDCTVYSSCGI
jgi:hypothetical protein